MTVFTHKWAGTSLRTLRPWLFPPASHCQLQGSQHPQQETLRSGSIHQRVSPDPGNIWTPTPPTNKPTLTLQNPDPEPYPPTSGLQLAQGPCLTRQQVDTSLGIITAPRPAISRPSTSTRRLAPALGHPGLLIEQTQDPAPPTIRTTPAPRCPET